MASEHVTRHLCNLIYGIYQEAQYSKKTGKLIKAEKILWDKTLKDWDTVYAICTDKIYDYNKKIIGYTLEDFNGNKMQVNSRQLKTAIALNKIDVVNLSLYIENGVLGSITEINLYNVNSMEEVDACIQERGSWEHYVVGNKAIGYFEVYGKTTLLDYKGYCKEVRLPKIKYTSSHAMSFNDYVQVLHIPDSYSSIDLGICYGAKALSDIYFYYDGETLVNIGITNSYRYGEHYTPLKESNNIQIHALHFNMTAFNFFEMMFQRKDLAVQLKIKQCNIDSNDPLQTFIVKAKMLGLELFDIDFSKRTLIRYSGKDNIETLKLPPVKRLHYRWFNEDCHIGTLYLPDTLEMTKLTSSNIPNKEERVWSPSGCTFESKLYKTVDKVVIPKGSSIKFVCDVDDLGIIFDTEYGIGTVDKIAIRTPNTGIKLKVIEFIKYPDVTLKTGITVYGHIRVVIEDNTGNRKSVTMNDLIDKIMDGLVQLTNAEVLLNRTIRIK